MSIDSESSHRGLCNYYGVGVDAVFRSEYVDSIDEEIDVDPSTEPLELYNSEWYCPIYLGEVLDERYVVENNLGWGGFSTVWMAYDKKTEKMVALKISSSGAGDEAVVHDELRKTMREDASHLVLYHDKFTIHGGTDGKQVYHVLVLPLHGPNLRDFCKHVPASQRMSGAEQVLGILGKLHGKGIILCDLKHANLVWDLPSLCEYSPKKRYELLGQPRKLRLNHPDWKFGERVEPVKIPPNLVKLGRVSICDFGAAISDQVGCSTQVTPFFMAPERLHGQPASPASDMWSFGCILFWLCFGGTILPFGSGNERTTMRLIVMRLDEPLSASWRERWEFGNVDESWYDENRAKSGDQWTLRAFMCQFKPEVDGFELDLVFSVLLKIFQFDPAKRPTAEQLKSDPEFQVVIQMGRGPREMDYS